MEHAVLKRVISDQREEMEERMKGDIIRREVNFSQFERWLSHPNIVAILGPRRCGKTVLSWQIFQDDF